MPKKTAAKKKVSAKKTAKKLPVAKNKSTIKATGKKKKKASKSVAKTKSKKATNIIAKIDVGFGNQLYIRGEGNGLSWDQGTPMTNIASDQWVWSTNKGKEDLSFKFLINDEKWSIGYNYTSSAGKTFQCDPIFDQYSFTCESYSYFA
jgi:hypothetical protein